MAKNRKSISDFFSQSVLFFSSIYKKLCPWDNAWNWAGNGLALAAILFLGLFAFFAFAAIAWWYIPIALLALVILFLLSSLILHLLGGLIFYLPGRFRFFLIFSLMALISVLLTADSAGLLHIAIIIVTVSLFSASLAIILKDWSGLKLFRKMLTLFLFGLSGIALLALIVLFSLRGYPGKIPENAAANSGAGIRTIEMENPALEGRYDVASIFYGSGRDRRPQFGIDVDLQTATVDGSPFLEGWSKIRTRIWGFDDKKLPLNGRVWYPDAEGKFPLVLIVHGNHEAEKYSDPGYEYMARILASRGFICVSVDENFLNGSLLSNVLSLGGLKEENDARAWLLLEHLALWEKWNGEKDSPFYRRVDMNNIALIGHSRGGEAISLAALFNRMKRYPGNGNIGFDYNFSIKALLALAPVDGQYKAGGRATELTNINYLAIHGSHDADVRNFMGKAMYNRVGFTGTAFNFKAAVYIWGANHAGFNSGWKSDLPEPAHRLFNSTQLLPEESQRRIALVYASAFLEASLKNERGWLPLFMDYRTAKAQWLPETVILNQYSDSRMAWLANFEEDTDPGTATQSRARIEANGLKEWEESVLFFDKAGKKKPSTSNSAVRLEWDLDEDASYLIKMPEGLLGPSRDSELCISIADARAGRKVSDEALNFSIMLVDAAGNKATLPLSNHSLVQPGLNAMLYKLPWLQALPQRGETIFQTFFFPMADFLRVNPSLKVKRITELHIIFDISDSGAVWLDEIGYRL